MNAMPKRIYCYYQFINKLIRAGRGEETKIYFSLDSEINRAKFIKFANKFIEEYHATVSPEFAISHRMKFSFGLVTDNGSIRLSQNVRSQDVHKYPAINIGILYIEHKNDEMTENQALDASVFRQACLIRRERFKFLMTVSMFVIAIITFALSLFIKK